MIIFTVKIFSERLQGQQFNVQEGLSEISELIQEDIGGMALIKIYAQEDNETRTFDYLNNKLLRANLKLAQIRNFLFPLIEGLSYISLLLLLIFGAKAITEGNISIGDASLDAKTLGVLSTGEQLKLQGEAEQNRLLLIAAKPINEPVARSGPFVMNSQEELIQAYEDYRLGNF